MKTSTENKRKKEAVAAYCYLFPSFIGLIFLTYIPLLALFVISFFNWRGLSEPTFAGFDNYVRMFTLDPLFWNSIRVTAIFACLAVAGSLTYSMIIALLMNRKLPARGLFRALFYLPYVLPAAAVYIGWSWLYEPNNGFFNYILNQIGINNVLFLNDSRMVTPSLALIAVWLSGNLIVIFLAGLQNVPTVYHEAAQIDGANVFQRFINVTLPCMTPIIFYNLLMSLITNMQIVTPALALTQGGPSGGSMFISYIIYHNAFRNNQIGYASALAFVFFIIIAIFTSILFLTSKGWIFYEGEEKR
jgi:multiple sugar transport system permease protein